MSEGHEAAVAPLDAVQGVAGRDGAGEGNGTTALVARMERETKPPELCKNCGEHPPVGVVVSPTPGEEGAPRAVWMCGWCKGLLAEAAAERERLAAAKATAEKRKRKRATRGRMSAGKHGAAIMALAFRFGGFSARQLAGFLLLQDPERFGGQWLAGEARARAELVAELGSLEELEDEERREAYREVERRGDEAAFGAARQAAADALSSLRKNKLMLPVGVWRAHVYGERGGRPEEFYYLSEQGRLWGAGPNGVADEDEARVAYSFHQLPKEAEHAAYRNDIYLRMFKDFEFRRRLSEGSGAPVDQASVVVSGIEDFNGESWEGFPYQVGRFQPRKGKAKPRRGREYEWLYPDGHPLLRWADELAVAFDLEAERTSGARKGAEKVDRYGAYWSRLYKLLEEEAHAPALRPLEEEASDIEERRAKLLATARDEAVDESARKAAGRELADERSPVALKKLLALREEIAGVKASPPPFLGLPEGVSPVLFVHQTEMRSKGVRQAIRDRQYPTPRYDEFVEHIVRAREAQLAAVNEQRREAGAPEIPFDEFAANVRRSMDSLFVFTSWEELRDGVDPESEEGGTLYAFYKSLAITDEAKATTLRLTAERRERMRPRS